MKRKIACILSSRATYGYSRPVMRLIKKSKKLELAVIVTGMHLLKEYGLSVNEIIRDGFKIAAKVDMTVGGDSGAAWAKSLGLEMQSLAQVFSMISPDIVLVEGDRAEQLIATVTAAYMNIPVAHLQSGDVSGHIDGSARHAITKLCHIHFPACEDSAKRVLNMGEEKRRVFNVGAPQLDEIVHGKKIQKKLLEKELKFEILSPLLMVIQHPVLVEVADARHQMIETMEAIRSFGFQTVVIYPNIDAGGEEMIRVIREYEKLPFIHTFKNIDRILFLNLLKYASALVGNSSCGILEAPSFKLAAVNIGTRQRGRMQANNVLNAPYDKKRIAAAVKKALFDKNFQQKLSRCVNPYGDGKSAARVVKILEIIPLTPELLDKKITC